MTSPPAIYRDLVIVGSAIGDNRAVELERGIVRAFDARTGALRWSWDPIPATATEAHARGWTADGARRTGAANAWSMISVDAGRGLVFVPTGSASPDFFGGERLGDNSYANSLVALRADTGQVAWHRQLVHHDLWDYDVAAQPMLIDIERDGKSDCRGRAGHEDRHAVRLRSRNRRAGVRDRRAAGAAERRRRAKSTSPTQPFPATPPLVSHAAVTPQDAWGLTFYDRGKCRELIERYRSEGIFTPPSLRGTILSPSYVGGVNWGSLAFDSERQLVHRRRQSPADGRHADSARSAQVAVQRFGALSGLGVRAAKPAPRIGMRREMLLSPLGLPCTAPPWGTLAAVDLRRNADPLAGHARLDPRPHALVRALAHDRHAEHGRSDRDRGRPGLHRRRHRQLPARVRHRDRARAVERPPAGRRPGDAHELRRSTAGSSW